ncbi:MAG: DUF305 domain-containing protein [Novosphingobium sp.]
MKFTSFAATAFCLIASAAGAQVPAKPAAATAPVAAPAPKVDAPVISPAFAPAAPVAAPAPRPAPVAVMSGDPFETWVRKMITHHRAAIAMAEAMMNNAQDRQAANLAKATFYREQRDVTSLQAWLKRHGKAPQ